MSRVVMSRLGAVASLLFLSGCPDLGPGADSMKSLESGLLDAIEAGDLHNAQDYFLDGQLLIEQCPSRFDTENEATFLRKLANGKRRFARYFSQCGARTTEELVIERRSGGRKLRQMEGCGEGVWEYGDLRLDVSSGGRRFSVLMDGILGIDGRYFIVERVRCR